MKPQAERRSLKEGERERRQDLTFGLLMAMRRIMARKDYGLARELGRKLENTLAIVREFRRAHR